MDDDIGEKLKARRERLGFTALAVAKQAGLHRVTLKKIEDGKGSRMTSVRLVERALDVLEGKPPAPASQAPVTIRVTTPAGSVIEVTGPVGSADELAESAIHLMRVSIAQER